MQYEFSIVYSSIVYECFTSIYNIFYLFYFILFLVHCKYSLTEGVNSHQVCVWVFSGDQFRVYSLPYHTVCDGDIDTIGHKAGKVIDGWISLLTGNQTKRKFCATLIESNTCLQWRNLCFIPHSSYALNGPNQL